MAENSSNTPTDVTSVAVPEETPVASKGKGKAVASEVQDDVTMDDDDDDEEDDDDEAAEDAEDDDEAENGDAEGAIDLDNVVPSRTRGKVIDFAKAAEENPVADDEDDEDEDGDFEDDDEMEED